jgi:hypothetical protein
MKFSFCKLPCSFPQNWHLLLRVAITQFWQLASPLGKSPGEYLARRPPFTNLTSAEQYTMSRTSRSVALVSSFSVLLLLGTSASWLSAWEKPAAEAKTALINVSAGQKPTDVGSDSLDKLSVVESKELGGQALRVFQLAGDTFGQGQMKITDWSAFKELRVSTFSPAKDDLELTLTISHSGSKDFDSRIDIPVTLPAGKGEISVPLAGLKNNGGGAPNMKQIKRWYLALPDNAPDELFFGDFWLVGGSAAGGGAKAAKSTSDPARIARIRAAKMPKITKPVMFDTPEADAIVSAMEIFPPDHALNQLVTDWPVHPNSQAIIDSVGAEKPLRYNPDMGYIIVPPNQKKIDLKNVEYESESDPGPYPIAENTPIEGWPANYKRDREEKLTLDDVQRNKLGEEGDRHAILVDPVNQKLYEFFVTKKTDAGWQAAQASIFDLKTGAMRPDGWTSSDAAGLPLFPLTVRYDELKRGVIDHPLRVTIRKSRRAYVHPATHFASRHENEEYPRMGERFRLRKDFDTSGFSPEVKTILTALRRYGMIVADNGIEWAVSVTPDMRIPVLHEELRKVKGSDFEVIVAP